MSPQVQSMLSTTVAAFNTSVRLTPPQVVSYFPPWQTLCLMAKVFNAAQFCLTILLLIEPPSYSKYSPHYLPVLCWLCTAFIAFSFLPLRSLFHFLLTKSAHPSRPRSCTTCHLKHALTISFLVNLSLFWNPTAWLFPNTVHDAG